MISPSLSRNGSRLAYQALRKNPIRLDRPYPAANITHTRLVFLFQDFTGSRPWPMGGRSGTCLHFARQLYRSHHPPGNENLDAFPRVLLG